jgi:hypothetical protein
MRKVLKLTEEKISFLSVMSVIRQIFLHAFNKVLFSKKYMNLPL